MDIYFEHQPLRVDEQMALAPTHLLCSIVAAYATDASCHDRLTIDDPGAWLCLPTSPCSRSFSQRGVEALPRAISPPLAPIVEHRPPRGQIAGKQPPRTATPDEIKDGVHNRAPRMSPWSATCVACWQVRFHYCPFGVGQIRVIVLLLQTMQHTDCAPTPYLKQFLLLQPHLHAEAS